MLQTKDSTRVPKTVFAVWYVKGFFETILETIKDMSISLEVVERYDSEFQEIWHQLDGYFPEEGTITIQQLSIREDPLARWKITLEVEDEELWRLHGPHCFSFSPAQLVESWNPDFTKPMYGEAAKWGIR